MSPFGSFDDAEPGNQFFAFDGAAAQPACARGSVESAATMQDAPIVEAQEFARSQADLDAVMRVLSRGKGGTESTIQQSGFFE
jgi:hypothetical protein